jgi:adenosylcobinamide-GDP ribazoletransferase
VRALVLAVHFLSIVRLPVRELDRPGALGRAGWWFPVVGLALGALVAGLDHAARLALPPLVAAALVVAAWKALTGGLHLDGLADCLDGLGARRREDRLRVMRDSRLGAFGAIGLVLALVLAVSAVAELPGAIRAPALLLAPTAGRLAPLVAGAWLRAATPGEGHGAAFLVGLSRLAGPIELVALAAFAAVGVGAWAGAALVAGLAIGLSWCGAFARRIGGLTGDVLGGGVEVTELGVLLAAIATWRALG